MDGNGRWAEKRGLPRAVGHTRGAEVFRKIATACKDLGVEYLTVYAFSTENNRRPEDEVSAILGLLRKYLLESIEKMERDGIRLKFLGNLDILPPDYRKLVRETDEISKRVCGMQANVCFNYGGRDELVRAVKRLGGAEPTEQALSDCLDTAGIPDPDLIIRPGGEKRLSNFLLWQAAYAELIFTDTLWPDFTKEELVAAFEVFSARKRRYGGVDR
ncbi:MAG: polyprenyl diphosphate synthase [Oscillospiraceae bacterium]|nr:polyprenyl diphosphate synthase [Oscillospiraceae bacterium]